MKTYRVIGAHRSGDCLFIHYEGGAINLRPISIETPFTFGPDVGEEDPDGLIWKALTGDGGSSLIDRGQIPDDSQVSTTDQVYRRGWNEAIAAVGTVIQKQVELWEWSTTGPITPGIKRELPTIMGVLRAVDERVRALCPASGEPSC